MLGLTEGVIQILKNNKLIKQQKIVFQEFEPDKSTTFISY